jgi:hypothetical protein
VSKPLFYVDTYMYLVYLSAPFLRNSDQHRQLWSLFWQCIIITFQMRCYLIGFRRSCENVTVKTPLNRLCRAPSSSDFFMGNTVCSYQQYPAKIASVTMTCTPTRRSFSLKGRLTRLDIILSVATPHAQTSPVKTWDPWWVTPCWRLRRGEINGQTNMKSL